MKIVVCIKQVPDTKGGVKFNPDGTLDRGAMLTIMNPDDKAGLEAALRLKEQYGAEVTVLTMGLPKADEVLREAMAMGADNGILVTDRVLGGADTWATSTTIAGAIRNLEYDLIITGRQAIDGDTAQVGPQISEHLDIPVISYAQEIKIDGDYVVVQRQYEDRYHELKAKMPSGLNLTPPLVSGTCFIHTTIFTVIHSLCFIFLYTLAACKQRLENVFIFVAHLRLFQQCAGNNHALNFRSSFVDLCDLSVTHHALYVVLTNVAIAAEQLNTLRSYFHSGLSRK